MRARATRATAANQTHAKGGYDAFTSPIVVGEVRSHVPSGLSTAKRRQSKRFIYAVCARAQPKYEFVFGGSEPTPGLGGPIFGFDCYHPASGLCDVEQAGSATNNSDGGDGDRTIPGRLLRNASQTNSVAISWAAAMGFDHRIGTRGNSQRISRGKPTGGVAPAFRTPS